MDANHQFDVVVIGSGPGGYVCAIRCAQLGLKTAIVEKNSTLGGTCLNIGCIPSKALLDSSEKYYQLLHSFRDHGIQVSDVKVDIATMMTRKDKVVKELTDGVRFLMNKNKVQVFQGLGSFASYSEDKIHIQVKGNNTTVLETKKCIIATGSQAILPEDIGLQAKVDGKNIIISDHALSLDKVPESMLVIGGGVIGLELGSVWNRLGTKVTIVEVLPDILMGLDKKMRQIARRSLEKQGLQFLLQHKVVNLEIKQDKVISYIETPKKEVMTLEVEKVLVAVGRKPYTEGLNAEKIGIEFTNQKRIRVNPETLETSCKNIYAIGDVIEGPMLAHKAEEEGIMVANIIANRYGHVNYELCPFVVYTWPEIAWAGKNEEQLKEEGREYKVGTFLFRANGRAKGMNEIEGQAKIISDKKTDRILGVAIIGPYASELMGECIVAMEFGASSEDLGRTFHSHPNLLEVIKEAALDVNNEAIHK